MSANVIMRKEDRVAWLDTTEGTASSGVFTQETAGNMRHRCICQPETLSRTITPKMTDPTKNSSN